MRWLTGWYLLLFVLVSAGSQAKPALTPFCYESPAACFNTQHQPLLPKRAPPKTIILIHGMLSNVTSLRASFIKLAQFIEHLNPDDPSFHVYAINYHSDNDAGMEHHTGQTCNQAGGCGVDLVMLNHRSLTCNARFGWRHCWQPVAHYTKKKFNSHTIDVSTISHSAQQLLIKAKQLGAIADGPITVIAHSMGGLVMRDLLYHGDESHTGYQLLKAAGVNINEYISFGTPHQHGFTSIDDNKIADLTCSLINTNMSSLTHQYCALTRWINHITDKRIRWKDGTKVDISKRDFPQIRWVFVAGYGDLLRVPDVNGTRVRGDGMVDYRSALFLKDDKHDRADAYLLLGEHYDLSVNQSLSINNNTALSRVIPASLHLAEPPEGCLASPVGINGYSCFDWGTDAIHYNLYAVGDPYLANTDQSCVADLKSPQRFTSCFGYFQYVLPETTLCLLPGYSMNNPYYQHNPQFSPQAKALDMHCKLR